MKIELLHGVLPVSEHPGLDSTDPRFDEIVTLTQAGKHKEAAHESEAIIAEGIYDIRLICYFLYGYWLENGLASLDAVNQSLIHLIDENWQALGPVKNQKTSLEKSLDWLFRQVLKKIKYEENKNSELWQEWLDFTAIEDADNIVKAGKDLCSSLHLQLEDRARSITDQWSKIEQWLRSFQEMKRAQLSQKKEGHAKSAEYENEAGSQLNNAQFEIFRTAAYQNGELKIEVSFHLAQLLKKINAFEILISKDKLSSAAILADDINQTLQGFDPKLYFPKIFESFIRLQAIHLHELHSFNDQKGNPSWEAMQEWLKVDTEGFINYAASLGDQS